ncbi:PREDICTED: uncharacterized protein LOC104592687 isoform X2 [Nelumbo nucifera]|nr:PREDICTED: uncharacterized protein LOC104592687 isoform X2 [Nelumbo nucifera]
MSDSGATSGDVMLEKLLNGKVLYSWGSKDIVRKVIFISSCLVEIISPITRKTLMDAADNCVSVEFVLLEQELIQNNISENIKEFINSISDLENCSFQTCLPDNWVLCGLVKRWLQELKGDLEDPLQAIFIFKSNIIGPTNRLVCHLFSSVNQIIDGFSSCQACRCHALPLGGAIGNSANEGASCPVTLRELGTSDLIENAVKVGEQTILFLPSFESCPKFHQVSSPIVFNVIERTNLSALSEGVIIGISYIVTPSAYHDMEATSDECDKSELNTQFFQGLRQALCSLDQGLVCSSNCNIETMKEGTLNCFYLLQPSDKGPMLLRRLAGAEEIMPVPDAAGSKNSAVPKEMEKSIQASLLEVKLRDYNPLLHVRGFHTKLDLLIKESLQFGSLPPKEKETSSESNSPNTKDSETMVSTSSMKGTLEIEDRHTSLLTQDTKKNKTKMAACITEECIQLIVNGVPQMCSPTRISKLKMEKSVPSSPDGNKTLNDRHWATNNKCKTIACIAEEWAQPIDDEVLQTCSPTSLSKSRMEKSVLVPVDSNKTLDANQVDTKENKSKNTSCVTEEWEQLIVNKAPQAYSHTRICKPEKETSVLLPSDGISTLDDNYQGTKEATSVKTDCVTGERKQLMTCSPTRLSKLMIEKSVVLLPDGDETWDDKSEDTKEDECKSTACITEEWEQLVVEEVPKQCSTIRFSKPKMEKSVLSPSDGNKTLDDKTSRILERLECPQGLKKRSAWAVITSDVSTSGHVLLKKPVVPFGPNHATGPGSASTRPLKPIFQRLKRK